VFWNSVDLFRLDVDLVFYDPTTARFECDEEDSASHEWRGPTFAPLRKRGHSKEGRDNDPQVIVALAVTRDGIPVRSWVLSGDTADVTTVQRIKDDLRQLRLGRALFVGHAGLYARANLAELSRGAGPCSRPPLVLSRTVRPIRRHTVRERLNAKLRQLKATLRRMRHLPIPEQGRDLRLVLNAACAARSRRMASAPSHAADQVRAWRRDYSSLRGTTIRSAPRAKR